ncbi:hypothetical protein BD779DRAFT_1480545 [Infundibulicybe gibba]|nr:hypothetical protein BD779DRAFT_1480545 [Infundibulicybe gibba]
MLKVTITSLPNPLRGPGPNENMCILSTENAFPLREDELDLAQWAWEFAFETKELDFTAMDHDMFRVIRGHGPQLRSEAKTKIIPLVASAYGFDDRRKRRIIEANRKLSALLKHEKNFLYKSLGVENQGLYHHPIIQKSINILWFSDAQDEGAQYPLVFGPGGKIPLPAIAFILTVIECGIDMWRTGIKKDITFRSGEYREIYTTHTNLLIKYEKETEEANLFDKLCRKLYQRAVISAGVNLPSDNPRHIIPASAYTNAIKQHRDNPQESDSDDLYED